MDEQDEQLEAGTVMRRWKFVGNDAEGEGGWVSSWETGWISGYSSPCRSIEISDLAKNLEIGGTHQVRGKILSRKDLGPIGWRLLTPLSPWLFLTLVILRCN